MSKSFDDLLAKVSQCSRKTVSVAVAQDAPILEAIKAAKEKEIADAILVGDVIISLLVQGTTVSGMANLLGLAYEERESAFSEMIVPRNTTLNSSPAFSTCAIRG